MLPRESPQLTRQNVVKTHRASLVAMALGCHGDLQVIYMYKPVCSQRYVLIVIAMSDENNLNT